MDALAILDEYIRAWECDGPPSEHMPPEIAVVLRAFRAELVSMRQNRSASVDYEREVARTARIEPEDPAAWSCAGLGIAGEAGEVADLLKKTLHHGRPLDREALVKELGDVLWYLVFTARLAGFSLADVMAANVAKLRKRFPNGFTETDAAARADEKGAA